MLAFMMAVAGPTGTPVPPAAMREKAALTISAEFEFVYCAILKV